MRLKTIVVKVIGVIFSVAGGLIIGKVCLWNIVSDFQLLVKKKTFGTGNHWVPVSIVTCLHIRIIENL